MKLKTRTNQPVSYELPLTSDIEHLSDKFLDDLKAGDIVEKKTGNMKHTYIVTYKEEKKGICLSYFDCGYTETISYDYTAGHWVFNSKDVSTTPVNNEKYVFNGDMEVKSLVQEPRYNFDFDLPNYTNFTKTQWFTKVIVIGNELHIIGNAYYLNTSETNQNMRFSSFLITLPEDISKLIYDANGDTLDKDAGNQAYIRSSYVSNTSGVSNVHSLRLTHAERNKLSIYEVDNSSVPPNERILKGFHIIMLLI